MPFQKYPLRMIVALTLILFVFFLCGFTKKAVNTENGLYQIDIEMEEQIHVGHNSMKMRIEKQMDKQPIDQDAMIEIVTWMSVHEHGTKVSPVITPLGDGNYTVEMLNFTMPGPWEILIRISKDDKEDTAVLNVSVNGEAKKGGMQMDSGKKMMGH